jgi:uncharacterized protein YjbI with pentapeptide repeats
MVLNRYTPPLVNPGGQIALLAEQNSKLEAQTTLLREQNDKLDQQTITAEAQRRAALSAEAFSLIHAVGVEPESRTVIARVVALTRAATPFYYVRVDAYVGEAAGRRASPRLIEAPLSPERGHLLQGLVAAGAEIQPLTRAGAVFEAADLLHSSLRGARLENLRLAGADLRRADLQGSGLSGTDLESADLRAANLSNAALVGARLTGANLSGSAVVRAQARLAHLVAANLSGADLRHADLRGSDLRLALLRRANFAGADLREADLRGADLSGSLPLAEALREGGVLLTDAIVGTSLLDSQLPSDFPAGWAAPPAGFELVEANGVVRLRLLQ